MENFSDRRSDLDLSHDERRTVPRYSVLALVEFAEAAGTMCIEGRMTEISRQGCYVNTPNTLPLNSFLRLVITRDEETFMTNGKVIYVHDGIDMGIVFVDSTGDQLQILNEWLADAAV
jgi:PilZ domain